MEAKNRPYSQLEPFASLRAFEIGNRQLAIGKNPDSG
jgi:hypothetical protein